jgi:SAM-dependent methyltransferase
VDRARISAITHGDLPFHNPLEPARIDEVLGLLSLTRGDRALDIGCGTGELLIRIAERFGCGGLGIDDAEIQIAEARRRAQERVFYAGLEFMTADARTGSLPGGPFALTACLGSMHAIDGDLSRLAELTRPGGHVLIADGYWQRPPTPEYLETLGATADELPDYAGLVKPRAGLEPVYASVTSQSEWDRYEWTLIYNGLRFAAENPGADEVAAWAERARSRYLSPGGRDTLGFALVLFRRQSSQPASGSVIAA